MRSTTGQCRAGRHHGTPIERITPNGIQTRDRDYEFDIIIYATGFDAITGSFDRIDFRGVDGARLKDNGTAGPQTFLGVLVDGFPNMMMLMGRTRHSANIPPDRIQCRLGPA